MLVFVLSLAALVTEGLVLSDLPRSHDNPGSGYTSIAIEVPFGTNLEYVFLRGGFSNNDNGRCTGSAQASDLSADPCSLPILTHVQPPFPNANYTAYSTNDRYLDFYGGEPNQGSAEGTPTTPLNATNALALLNSNDSGVALARRIPNTFWFVQLQLDCSKSNGLFEVEVVPVEGPGVDSRARSYDTPFLQRSTAGGVPRRFPTRINFPKNFDFSRLPTLDNPGMPFEKLGIPDILGHRPNRSDTPLAPDGWLLPTFNRSAAPRAMGWRANMDTASGMDTRPFPITPLKVEARDVPHPHRRPLLRDQRISKCQGTAGFTPPYSPGMSQDGLRFRHIGLCGHANIFRYGTDSNRYCEVNTMPS